MENKWKHDLNINVDSSIIHNRQEVETTPVSIQQLNGQMQWTIIQP